MTPPTIAPPTGLSASAPGIATSGVRTGDRYDVNTVVRIAATAMASSPLGEWLVADANMRAQVCAAYLRLHVEYALGKGFIHIAPSNAAVAVWLDTGFASLFPRDYDHQLNGACGRWRERFARLDMARFRASPTVRHHHLLALATTPQHGAEESALLVANAGPVPRPVPAYAGAVFPGQRALLHRHGYHLNATTPLALDHGGPLLWPMTRSPEPSPHLPVTGPAPRHAFGDLEHCHAG